MFLSYRNSIKDPLFPDFLLHFRDRVECFFFVLVTERLSDGNRELNEERQGGKREREKETVTNVCVCSAESSFWQDN